MNTRNPSDWSTVGNFMFEHEAALVAGLLENQGISTRLLDAGMVGVAPHLSNAIGGVRLQVGKEDFDLAVSIVTRASSNGPITGEELGLGDGGEDEGTWEEQAGTPSPDRLAAKAFFAAILGVSFAPVIGTFFSLRALSALYRRRGDGLRPGSRVLVGAALLLDVLVGGAILAFLFGRI